MADQQQIRSVMVTNLNDVHLTESPGGNPEISQAVIIKCSKLQQASEASSPISRSPVHAAFFKQKSMLPKPEISPKPAHLKPSLMTGSLHLSPPPSSEGLMTGSMQLPKSSDELEGPSTKTLSEKTKGTASILKNTLKRMTKLSIRAATASPSSEEPVQSGRSMSPFRSLKKCEENGLQKSKIKNNSLRKSSGDVSSVQSKQISSAFSQNSLNRKANLQRHKPEAFKVPEVRSLSRSSSATSTANMNAPHRSHSLKRSSRNKDIAAANGGNGSLQRSGSGSGINQVKRSNSMHQSQRRFRDRDLNVKLSRGIQTQLTKDAAVEDEDNVVTSIDFSLYMPDLLGGDTGNEVETHVSEPTEPVDVRRNRQLTLDNMKLHREIEKLKSAANESDHLKRELRSVRARLEEEQRARARIEHELDQHNEKVKLIAKSMDSVEQEFEIRDSNIKQLESQVQHSRSHVATLEDKLKVANEVIQSQNLDLAEAVAAQKAAVKEYEVAESEANELHEFLRAEKFTLAEALREAESEVVSLKAKVSNSEEQCGHLVRLGEQRHQEILALETQLKAMEDKAKEMLLAQGAEISRSTILIAELSCKIEELFKSNYPKEFDAIAPTASAVASEPVEETQTQDEESEASSIEPINNDDCDESLLNLSNAIKNRVSVEKNLKRSSLNATTPNLVERIAQVDKLVDYFAEAAQNSSNSENGTSDRANGIEDDHKENISLNGNSDSGNGSNGTSQLPTQPSPEKKKYEEEMAEMKAKYLKHRQILVSNREQAESEVTRLDEIYHDTVNDVLGTLAAIPDVVKSNQELANLQNKLQMALLDDDPKPINGKLKVNGILSQNGSTEQSL